MVTTTALDQSYSKCGPLGSSIGATWELVRCTLSVPGPDLVNVYCTRVAGHVDPHL